MEITFTQFAYFVRVIAGEAPLHQRRGQWAFNILHELDPDIANTIRTTEADPFYDDARTPKFLTEVLKFVVMEPKNERTD